ncbi:Major Facilitator Superfamily protein [Planctomycetes bacterium Pan216]|uniref:Major Facilitator Superfamily protein n=1 Tax=Kolteria novifilia TaxID=2527975 RepID=A0A518B5Q4_9BACT|nr:Major Facilitator Superfamily protein [Planctomycetes bacterium Pan216]
MLPPSSRSGLERNASLYPLYASLFAADFWLPVFFLYFSESLSLEAAILLESIYFAAVFLLEIPSGYFSDVIGRRITLVIAAATTALAYGLFFFATTFWQFALAQILLAGGIAFNRGTDVSFHFDTLASLEREEEFAPREALVARNTFAASAIASLGGGVIGWFSLSWAYAASLLAALGALLIALRFTEPAAHERPASYSRDFAKQIGRSLAHLRDPALAWIFLFSIFWVVLNHIPYEFYQPYIRLVEAKEGWSGRSTPLVAGLSSAGAMLVGAFVAARSTKLCQRIGTAPTMLISLVIQGAIIGVMSLMLDAWVVVMLFFRVVPRALATAPINVAVAPRVEQSLRATYLSLQSLVGRLAVSGVLAGLWLLPKDHSASTWDSLSVMLRAASVIAVVGLGLLLPTAGLARIDRAE